MAIGLKIKHSTGEITTGTGNLTLNAASDLVLDYATFPSSDGTAGYILSTDGAGNLSWIADSGGPADTDALPEGGSNLYYTNVRAQAVSINNVVEDTTPQLGGTLDANSNTIDMGTNVITDAKVAQWDTVYATSPQYNQAYVWANAGHTNWDTAYGWGNHALAGYLTATLTDEQVEDKVGAMLTGNTETLITVAYQDSDGTIDFTVDNNLANYSNASSGFLTSETSHADVVQDGDFTSQGIMLRGGSAGVYSILTDASANWNTAFGWGNHASAGYLTATLTDEQVQDKVGAMFVGNTETLITTTYQDSDGTLDFVVDNNLANYSNASSGFLTTISGQTFTTLSDVDAVTAAQDGKILYYDHASTSFKWKTDAGGAAAAGGSDTYVQYNDSGVVAGDAGFTYNAASDTVTAGSYVTAGASPQITSAGALAIQSAGTMGLTTTTGNVNINATDHVNILTTAGNSNIIFNPHGTGAVYILERAPLHFMCENDTHSVALRAPLHASFSSSYTLTLPGSPGTAGQLLSTDGAGTLSWVTDDDTIANDAIKQHHIDWGTGSGQVNTSQIPESTNLYYTDARADARITNAGSANWNTAYGWGDHLSGGYLTSVGVLSSHTDVHNAAPTDGQVLTWVAGNSRWEPAAGGGGGGSQNLFETIAVTGQTDVIADSTTDTLTLVAGSNMTITTSFPDTITFASSGGGGGGSSSFTFTVNYSAGGTGIASVSNLPSGWSASISSPNVTITHTANGQPMGLSFYGLDKSASPDVWKYGYPTSTYPVTFPDTGAGEVISTTEFTLNVGTTATGANTGTPFATSLAHVKVIF